MKKRTVEPRKGGRHDKRPAKPAKQKSEDQEVSREQADAPRNDSGEG